MKNILLLFCLTTLQVTAQTKMELRPPLKSNIKWELINVSSDGQWLVTGQDRDLVIWDRNTQVQVASFPFCLPKKLPDSLQAWILEQDDWRDSEKYLAVAFLPDPELVAVWREWEYELGNRQEHKTQRLRDSTGEHAVQELILWNWRENKIVDQIPFEIKSRSDIREVIQAISADGLRCAMAIEMKDYTHQIIVYDWKTRKAVFNKKIDGYTAPRVNPNVHDVTNEPYIQDIKFTDNSHELLIGWYENSYNGTSVQANAIDKWDLNTGQKVDSFTPKPDWEHKNLLCFSPGKDGRYLLAAYRKTGDDTRHAVGIVRWNLKTGEIDPLPGVKNFYKTIHGDFPKHELANSYFFNDNRYFFSKRPGVYDVNSNTASTLYDCPLYNDIYHATSVVPIPGNNALFLTDRLKIVDLSLQINWDMQRLSLDPDNYSKKNIFFGKDGLLVFKGEKALADMSWSLKNLRGTSSFIKDPASRAVEIGVTSTGEFKDKTGSVRYDRDSAFFINPKTGIKNMAMEAPSSYGDLYYSADGRWSIKQESYNSTLYEINWKENKYIVNNKFGNEDRWNAYIVFCFSPQHNYFYGIANRSKRERETPVWRLLKISLPDLQIVDSMDLSKERWDWEKAGGGIRDKTKIICNANDLFLAFSNNYGDLFIYDVRKKQITAPFNKTIQDFKFSPDGKQLAIAHYNQIEIYDLPDLTLRHTLVNRERIKAFDINPEATRLAMLAADGFTVSIWDWQKATLIATLIANPKEPGQYCYFTPDYYYAVNKGHESDFGFQQGDQYYSYDQLDFFYNRPDIIMQRLGFADPGYIARLESAYQTRIKKSGLTKALENTSWQVPEVVVNDGAPLPARTKERKMQIKVAASDQLFPLALIRISINEVPLLGARGKDISKAGKLSFLGVFEIELVQRINVIEVQAVNSQGIASFKQRFTVVLEGDLPAPDLHLVCIGVSKYKDAGMNLQYADKDAADVGRLFKDRSGAFRNLFHYEYLNEAVTKEKIAALRSKLAQSKPEDMVIVFAAGHGLLDHKLDFYFASHDVDFSNPQARGIPFDLLESLLTDIPARQKVLLLDACFSGELDESIVRKETTANTANNGKVVFRSVHTKVLKPEGADNSFDLMKDLFVDLRRGSGAVIISAAGGSEAAMEGGGITNGVFTYALKEAFQVKPGDKKNAVTITDVQKYVFLEVSRRTGGVQQPTSRVEYLYNDFVVWKFIDPYENRHATPNDIKNAALNGADVNQIFCDQSMDGDTECSTLLMKVVNDYDDVELVHWLVSRGADPFKKGTLIISKGYYGNLLSIAAAQGKVDLLKYFIETCKIPVDDKELDSKTGEETGWTALQWAANNGQLSAAQYLLGKNAQPDARTDEAAETPLMLAVSKGHLDLAKLLVKYGANCHLKKDDGNTAFYLAVAAGQLECAKWLASIDTTREEKTTDGFSRLMYAANAFDDLELIRLLVSNGANPARKGTIYLYDQFGQKTDGYYGNLLGLAAAQGKMALLKYFIEECKLPVDDKEYSPETKTDAGWTGLQWAANNGQIEAARYLLDKGAKPDERTDETVDTPLMLAMIYGHLDLAKLLVKYGASWQLKKSDGDTVLHLAAKYKQLDCVKWLVSLGADTKAKNKAGYLPVQVTDGDCRYYLFNLK